MAKVDPEYYSHVPIRL